ncbi:hypothetical protein SAICODRAFT_226253, partial [Saitoella complicata NRRL Y-17804]|uniref:uncharacterized protein n=1 Tax=Saitoella complicata (strain BCRC 22490 / CBS 7301 / JCM 7358 / NBRC 10748 / NRRL Y-17804) TaxID=698492 RepID=UPI0008680F1C
RLLHVLEYKYPLILPHLSFLIATNRFYLRLQQQNLRQWSPPNSLPSSSSVLPSLAVLPPLLVSCLGVRTSTSTRPPPPPSTRKTALPAPPSGTMMTAPRPPAALLPRCGLLALPPSPCLLSLSLRLPLGRLLLVTLRAPRPLASAGRLRLPSSSYLEEVVEGVVVHLVEVVEGVVVHLVEVVVSLHLVEVVEGVVVHLVEVVVSLHLVEVVEGVVMHGVLLLLLLLEQSSS